MTLPIVDPVVLYRASADTPAGPWHGRWTTRDRAERQALGWQHQHDVERVWLEKAAGTRYVCAVLHQLDAA